jgi:hypothetical protein
MFGKLLAIYIIMQDIIRFRLIAYLPEKLQGTILMAYETEGYKYAKMLLKEYLNAL